MMEHSHASSTESSGSRDKKVSHLLTGAVLAGAIEVLSGCERIKEFEEEYLYGANGRLLSELGTTRSLHGAVERCMHHPGTSLEENPRVVFTTHVVTTPLVENPVGLALSLQTTLRERMGGYGYSPTHVSELGPQEAFGMYEARRNRVTPRVLVGRHERLTWYVDDLGLLRYRRGTAAENAARLHALRIVVEETDSTASEVGVEHHVEGHGATYQEALADAFLAINPAVPFHSGESLPMPRSGERSDRFGALSDQASGSVYLCGSLDRSKEVIIDRVQERRVGDETNVRITYYETRSSSP